MLRLLLPAVVGLAAGPANAQGPSSFSFGVIGDVPYSAREERLLREVIAAMDREDLAFVAHIGDIKAGSEPCSDELLLRRRDLLASTRHAFLFTPGDNEWTDCHRDAAGRYDPVERLARLREWFFSEDVSLGGRRLPVVRQSNDPKFRDYRENMRWEVGGVVFVTLNVPGSNNNYRFDAGRNGEFEDRLVANRHWLARAAQVARQQKALGLVVMWQANPDFEEEWRTRGGRGQRDGFAEIKQALREAMQDFGGKVLLIHGDTHAYRYDNPLRSADSKASRSFRRLETFGSPFVSNWVRVTVDPSQPELFVVDPRRLADAPSVSN